MKKIGICALTAAFMLGVSGITSIAVENKAMEAATATIREGIVAEDVNLAGFSRIEAKAAIEARVEEIKNTPIILNAAGGNTVRTTAGELGVIWVNPEIIDEALVLGDAGDVVTRYKLLKDMENGGIDLHIEIEPDKAMIKDIIEEYCVRYDKKVVNTSLKRDDGSFQIIEGTPGYATNVDATVDRIYDFLSNEWDHYETSIDLVVEDVQPAGDTDELMQLTDLLGTFTTSYKSSGTARAVNVANGCKLINGTTLYPGEEFSTLAKITPFTLANGYQSAGSYSNGLVVESIGGGICQVSSTLYNAVLRAELSVTERHNHSMIVSYVEPSDDAAIAEDAGTDFRFVNNLDHPIYIEGITADKTITFNIYGIETRDPAHSVEFESEILEEVVPEGDAILTEGQYPLGYVSVQSAHTGYSARLWKIVKENGVETGREIVNKSTYKAVQRTAIVGVATTNQEAQRAVITAVGTGDLEHVRAVINQYTQPRVAVDQGEED